MLQERKYQPRFLTIRGKYIVLINVFLLIIFSVLLLFWWRSEKNNITQNILHYGTQHCNNFVDDIQKGELLTADSIADEYTNRVYIKNAYVVSQLDDVYYIHTDPDKLFKPYRLPMTNANRPFADLFDYQLITYTNTGERYFQFSKSFITADAIEGQIIARAYIEIPIDVINRQLRMRFLVFIVILLSALVVGTVMMTMLSAWLVSPIKKLSEGVQIIGRGNLRHRIHITQRDELGQLADDINTMARELTRAEKVRVEQEVIKREIKTAADIQRRLLPQSMPKRMHLDIAADSVMLKKVGGDYYDFFIMNDSVLGVFIGDVSGKSIPAALVMIICRSTLRAIQTYRMPTIKKTLSIINHILYSDTRSGMFMTAFYGVFNEKKKTFLYGKAGHEPTLFFRSKDAAFIELVTPGLPLGLAESERFDSIIKESSISFKRGDIFLFYTDGLTDMHNADHEEFGLSHIKRIIKAHAALSAQELLKKIITATKKFVGRKKLTDDMTIVLVKIK